MEGAVLKTFLVLPLYTLYLIIITTKNYDSI